MPGRKEGLRASESSARASLVSGNHHPAPSHCMKIQWKWIDTYHEGRGWVGQNSNKASKGENATHCTEHRCVTETSMVQRSISITFHMPHGGDEPPWRRPLAALS